MSENDQPQIYRDRYKVLKKLGAGNFGTAYLVADLKAKQELKVLKVVRLGEMDAEQSVDSRKEAELLAELNHEHIVKFYESFLDNDCLCIVTEFCEGGDLDQRFKELKKQNKTLDEDQIVQWLIEILLAVQYMHKSRVLHRDLKARNIFLKSNRVKIGDFGISRILVGTMDVATTFTGTPYYMSPEVMKHDGYESKSDIWSVGCLLYEMCTYQHAFDGKGLMNVIYKVVEGQTPELPKSYGPELNELLKKMFTKDPKQRPSAVELLHMPFLLYHRQRLQINVPLENTISGNRRLKQLHSRLENDINFGDMKKQGWTLINDSQRITEGEEEEEEEISTPDPSHPQQFNDDDDDDDVQLGNNSFYNQNRINSDYHDDFDDQPTLKAEKTFKTERETMIERKKLEADARAQVLSEAMRSNRLENALNRQMMRESTMIGTMKQPWPSSQPFVEVKEQPTKRLSKTMDPRTHQPTVHPNEATFVVRKSYANRPNPISNNDDRPITPMRSTYKQIAAKFNKDVGLPTDPSLTNQYYEACNDFEQDDDQSPTREKREREFNEQILRSINGHESSPKFERTLSASQRSQMNSMSRTYDPRQEENPARQSKYLPSSRNSRRTKHDANASFRDSPTYDAYGPMAKDKKIKSLRSKAIEALGAARFNKIHNYLIEQRSLQRTDSTLDDARINEDLRKFDAKPSDCFLVDQLVFLELVSNEK